MKEIKRFIYLCVLSLVLLLNSDSGVVSANFMDKYQNTFVTEELRLKVPSKYKDAWFKAEKNIWEPWLLNQEGFMGRQIFWNPDEEQALILVNWKEKKLWKSIPMKEVIELQAKFEETIKKSLDLNNYPFELVFEGELYKQG